MAIATGNTLILKPSERDPGAGGIIAELCERAGIPKGVLNIIHGGVETVNFICDEPRIKAISFVGSDIAGKHIWDRGSKNGKRVQANLGAKSEFEDHASGSAFACSYQILMIPAFKPPQSWSQQITPLSCLMQTHNSHSTVS